MDKYQFRGKFQSSATGVKVTLSLISFKENDVVIIYSPALDISGYGNDELDAKISFEIVLEEFLRYTINKGSFEYELKKMGWKLSGKKSSRKYKQPYLDHLLKNNKYLIDIVREKEFHRINKTVSLPAYA